MVRQRSAKPCTAVQIRSSPPVPFFPAWVAELVDARDLRLFWAPRLETLGVNGVKFGETSARRGGGNPELIPG